MTDNATPETSQQGFNEPWVVEFVQMLDCVDPNDLRIEEAYALKAKHLPKTLYRYRKFDDEGRNLSGLENDLVNFSASSNFNDPFDCLECFKAQKILSVPNMIKTLQGKYYFDENTVNSILSASEPFEELQRYMLERDGREKEYPEFIKAVHHAIDKDNGEYLKEYNDRKAAHIRIASFSEKKDSILMWSHYANCHRGFCVEYDMVIIPITNIRIKYLYPVFYTDKLYDVTKHLCHYTGSKEQNIYRWLVSAISKAQEWSYEKEWRMILETPFLRDDSCLSFAPISAVYLGRSVDSKSKDRVLATCARKKIPVFQAEVNPYKYALDFKKLEDSTNARL